MIRAAVVLALACLVPARAQPSLRPPLWTDADASPMARPQTQRVSELYAILYNTWLRHLDPEYKALCARDRGALNANAWDEVPDSSWFTNRIGRQAMTFSAILRGLDARPPQPPPWTVEGIIDEGYTPKLTIRDSAARRYVLKFDPAAAERNSGAERISTLAFYAAGYNVPGNTIAYFAGHDLRLADSSTYSDAAGKKRPMTAADLRAAVARVQPLTDGRYRALASAFLSGGVGKFKYSGTRKDDPNDLIPHELRRELRGLYVIASWLNHVDSGDKNTFDAYIGKDGEGFIRHYLMDFGSSLGAGDFLNGPYRVGHEYVFDGAAMKRTFATLGIWRRPWDAKGRIRHPEVGYFESEIFAPQQWRPNYPNLAFVRMDEADAYWGAKIVTAFSNELIQQLAEAGQYSRAEVTVYVADTLQRRRDAIGAYWLDRITPLEDFALEGDRLTFRDLAVERGYARGDARAYRLRAGGDRQPIVFHDRAVRLRALPPSGGTRGDRYGRTALASLRIQSQTRAGGWALPVEIVLGRNRDRAQVEVLGWQHAAREAKGGAR